MPNFSRDDVYKPKSEVKPAPAKSAPVSKTVLAQVPKEYKKPVEQYKPAEIKALQSLSPQPRPQGLYPPTTSGPANSPQGVLRSHVAADNWMSDDARKLLSQTPVHWNPRDEMGSAAGGYSGSDKGINLKTWGQPPESPATQTTLAHEFGHAWQDQRTPGFNDPNYPDQFLSDVNYYAGKDKFFNAPVEGWNGPGGSKATHPDLYAQNDPYTDTSELGARIFAGVPPHRLPPDFRNRYYPGMYRPDTPYAGPQYPAPPKFVAPYSAEG